jgi:peptidoglycan pentaglycine glycine transferase (the first glycine)
MQVVYLSSSQRDMWDALAAQSPSFTLMQSWEWGKLKESRGWRALRLAVEEGGRLVAGAQVMVRSLPLGLGSMAYVPRGPVGDWLSSEVARLLLNELKHIAQENKVIFLRMEPSLPYDPAAERTLEQFGFILSKFSNQPRATLLLDLTPDVDHILAQTKKIVQNRIQHAQSSGVTVRFGEDKDILAFYELMRETGNRGGFLPRTYDYYEEQWRTFVSRDEASLLLAHSEGRLLAARMGFRFKEHAAALHACSTLDHTELRATWLLAWEEIKWAKSSGCRTYDLWGIPDEVGQASYRGKVLPTKGPVGGLWGVYQFKRGFTRNVVYYLGAYDYVRKPLLYHPVMRALNNHYLDRLTAMVDSVRHMRKTQSRQF